MVGTKYLRLKQIIEQVPVGKSTWWAWVKSGRAPKPIKLSNRVTVWRESDVEVFMEQLEG